MTEVRMLALELRLVDVAAADKEAVRMDIHYQDGSVERSEDLDWMCTRTGFVATVDFFDDAGALLWTWRPKSLLALINGTDQLTMPSRVTTKETTS